MTTERKGDPMPLDDPTPLRRRATDREGHVEVNVYKFLSDLADIGARTNALERGHDELRREVREGNAAVTARFVALEAHLATQDAELVRQRETALTQHKEVMDTIATSAAAATTAATDNWNREHEPLLELYRSIAGERTHRRESQRRMARVGYAMIGTAGGVFAVLVAGSLNRLQYVPNTVYFTVVAIAAGVVIALVVFATVQQSSEIAAPSTKEEHL